MTEFLSSMFTHMSYHRDTAVLRVRFNRGAEYDYRNIPDKLYLLFVSIDGTNRRLVNEGMPEAQVSLGRVFYYTVQCNAKDYPFTEVPKDGTSDTEASLRKGSQCGTTTNESQPPEAPPSN